MNNTLDEAARLTRNEYYRQYRAANKDKIRKYNENYWTKKAKEKLVQSKKKKKGEE